MKLKENKGMSLIVFTIILAVLLVIAGGAIVYLLNNQQTVPQIPTGEQNNVVNNESTVNKNEENKGLKLTDFVGNYEFDMGPDGPNTIKITSNGEGLKIDWVEGQFNGSDARTIKVKSYKLQNNKLVIEVEGDSSNSIIFKENGKTYFTIEGIENEEGFEYFPIEMSNVTENNKDDEQPKENPIIEILNGENDKYIITAKDKNNNVLWTYTTKECPATELETVEFLTIIENKVYINEDGTIIALNKDNGKVIWKNSDYKGASSCFCVDSENNLYIAGYYGPFLCIIDENGKTIKRIGDFGDKYIWPARLELKNNKELVITCTIEEMDSGVLVVNLKDYSTKVENKK